MITPPKEYSDIGAVDPIIPRQSSREEFDWSGVGARGLWHINSPNRFTGLGLNQLWRARELLFFLGWRDVKVRYKQTVLGVLWAVLQPALLMGVLTLLFSRLTQIPSHGVPYPIFVYTGLIPWQVFAAAYGASSGSLLANDRMLTKVAFPRLVLPIASLSTSLADGLAASTLLIVLLAWYQIVPGPSILILPVFLLTAAVAGLGCGLWLGPLNVQFRDFRYVLPFMIQLLFFLTPVVYPSSLVPEQWRLLYSLNPLVGIIEGFRWSVFDMHHAPDHATLVITAAVLTVLIVGGLHFFRRTERSLADLV